MFWRKIELTISSLLFTLGVTWLAADWVYPYPKYSGPITTFHGLISEVTERANKTQDYEFDVTDIAKKYLDLKSVPAIFNDRHLIAHSLPENSRRSEDAQARQTYEAPAFIPLLDDTYFGVRPRVIEFIQGRPNRSGLAIELTLRGLRPDGKFLRIKKAIARRTARHI